jgi:hypothetical protein
LIKKHQSNAANHSLQIAHKRLGEDGYENDPEDGSSRQARAAGAIEWMAERHDRLCAIGMLGCAPKDLSERERHAPFQPPCTTLLLLDENLVSLFAILQAASAIAIAEALRRD